MSTVTQRILELLAVRPGLTDREITDVVYGTGRSQQPVNSACHSLVGRGLIARRKRADGLIGNYPNAAPGTQTAPPRNAPRAVAKGLSEDRVKQILERWLRAQGWEARVAWGKAHGVDIVAIRGQEKWFIEAKGGGSRSAMRVSYFLGALGETLQRMDDPDARYSIALPDIQQFRRLWGRLPPLAKSRTHLTALFVNESGNVRAEEEPGGPGVHE